MDRTSEQKEVTVFLDRIEEIEEDSSEAVFLFEKAEDEFHEFVLPTEFLPEGAGEGEYLTLKISRDVDKTREALSEARELLKNLEE